MALTSLHKIDLLKFAVSGYVVVGTNVALVPLPPILVLILTEQDHALLLRDAANEYVVSFRCEFFFAKRELIQFRE